MHAVIPHADMIYASTRSSEGPSLRDGRYVNKLSNLLSLTECGFYDRLEEDGLFYLNMGMYCRPRRPSATVIFKIVSAPKRNPQKRERSFVLLPCCSSKRCLLSCMVGLIQLPNSTRVICFQGYGPCGCQGRRGARVSAGFIASKV
jgi:hypothetical protein